jgi:hypothetical protein
MKTSLSIIIANYNTCDLILNCIKSIKSEESGVSREIIVVDNGSSDGSIHELEKLQKEDSFFTLIKNDNNYGFSKAVNQGIKIAQGEYILLLNSDTLVKRNSLGKLVDFAKTKNDAGVIGPKLIYGDGKVQTSVFNFPTVINAIREYWRGEKSVFESYTPQTKNPAIVDAVVGAAFLITPKALKTVGLLDERYFMYFEDLDYCKRVWKSGLKVYYLPGSEIVHYHGISGKKVAKEELQWRRLIPSSKIYHGVLRHYLINFIIWSSQKWEKILKI